ncbi:MAG: carbohydrate-binding family 9-like protein [Eubacteriales bacterium]|nr:carbohydrate-binding family 9-like protein [Eubacteriales bacterium]
MEYQVKTIASREEIESADRFEISHFMWNCLRKPRAWGWMGYLPGQGLYVKLVCEESDPRRIFHNYMDMVCKDSAMEVFLAFPEKGEPLTNDVMYLNFEANGNGALYAAYGKGRKGRRPMPEKYLEQCGCRAQLLDDRWILTWLIPEEYVNQEAGAALGRGAEFYCNFYKIAESPDIEHYAAFAPIENEKPNFHLPVFFAKAKIV